MFLVIALEYACFPVPSEIVLPFAGAYAMMQGVPFVTILIGSAAAGLIGCLVCYLIGRLGGYALMDGLSKKHKKLRSGIQASQEWFDRYGGLSVMIGRVLPLCRTYISFVAGLSKQNPVTFMAYSLAGIVVWNFVLTGLGYRLASGWEVIALYAKRYMFILLPAVLLIIYFVALSIIRRAKNSRT